jgi:hypothetical protein
MLMGSSQPEFRSTGDDSRPHHVLHCEGVICQTYEQELIPIYDELLAAEVEEYVAVVITSSRAFGLAAETSALTEIRLRVRETIKAIKITSSKATVRTSDRLLTFEVTGSTWNEYRF